MRYETSHLCSYTRCCRAAAVAGGPALRQCLYGTPLPDPAGQQQRPRLCPDRPQPPLRRRYGPQRPAGLPPRRLGLFGSQIVPAPLGPGLPGRAFHRPSEGPAAPQSTLVRQADQPVDLEAGGPGLPRQGLDAPAAHWRGHPRGPQAPGHPLAAGQALDHQSRPAVRAKKKARDRLIRLALAHPDWVLGYLDETWWSRLALPNLHAWTDSAPLRLVERTAA